MRRRQYHRAIMLIDFQRAILQSFLVSFLVFYFMNTLMIPKTWGAGKSSCVTDHSFFFFTKYIFSSFVSATINNGTTDKCSSSTAPSEQLPSFILLSHLCPHSLHPCSDVSPCISRIETESAKISTKWTHLLAWTLPVTKNFIQFIYFSFFSLFFRLHFLEWCVCSNKLFRFLQQILSVF